MFLRENEKINRPVPAINEYASTVVKTAVPGKEAAAIPMLRLIFLIPVMID